MDFTTKDSGERQEFDSGSVRDTRAGKGRFDLLPPLAIKRLAQLYERGAAKYGDRNWELGQPLSRYADSMLRHAFQAAAGETDEDHWAAVAWNAFAVMDHLERIDRGTLDRPLNDLPIDPNMHALLCEKIREAEARQEADAPPSQGIYITMDNVEAFRDALHRASEEEGPLDSEDFFSRIRASLEKCAAERKRYFFT